MKKRMKRVRESLNNTVRKRKSIRLTVFSPEGWPAAGFVYVDEHGRILAMFLPPKSRAVEPLSHFIVLGEHKTIQQAKLAVEDYVLEHGYTRTHPGQPWWYETWK